MTKCWQAPPELKHWLQVSYDKETEHFKQKRLAALQQLVEAKEAVGKNCLVITTFLLAFLVTNWKGKFKIGQI